MNEKITVIKLENNGSYFIGTKLSEIIEQLVKFDINDLYEDDPIIISKIQMSKEEYENLPEFDGF